jgi:hypothetical protein
MSVIPATQEAEIRRIAVAGQPEQNINETLVNKTNCMWWHALSCQLHLEAIGRRITVLNQANSETLSEK